jgi:hypothetical protein
VAHPLLNRTKWCAGGRHACAKRVTQIVEADWSQPSSLHGSLEPFLQYRRVKHRSQQWVRKDKILVTLEALTRLGPSPAHRRTRRTREIPK